MWHEVQRGSLVGTEMQKLLMVRPYLPMAGVGHITVYGLGNYAKSFKNTAPQLNKLVTDSIRVSNQWLVGLSALISSFNYWKMGRLVLPLAVSLGAGSIVGSWLSVTLSQGKVSFSAYQGYFGLFVLFLGAYLFWGTTSRAQAGKKQAKEAARAFEETVKRQKSGEKVDTKALGVKVTSISLTRVTFTFYGVQFGFNPLIPFIGGIVIAGVAAFLGVGGGFLLVPFLTNVAQLPMPIIFGDPEKLKQVWINLLTNARDALAGPGGTILVRSRLFSERQQVTAWFADTGPGISPENQHRIFDPFFTTKPVGQGTGLGLSVSFGIIKDHGGTIDVQSPAPTGIWGPDNPGTGYGTVIRVDLPLDHEEIISGDLPPPPQEG